MILEMLPELGVTEKKTHSSSIDEPVAGTRAETRSGPRRIILATNRLRYGSRCCRARAGRRAIPRARSGPRANRSSRAKSAPSPAPEQPPRRPPMALCHTRGGTEKIATLRPPLLSGGSSAHSSSFANRRDPGAARARGPANPAKFPLRDTRQPMPASTPPPPHPSPGLAAPQPGAACRRAAGRIISPRPLPDRPKDRPRHLCRFDPRPRRPNLAGQPAARPGGAAASRSGFARLQQQARPAPGQAQPPPPRPGMPTRSSTPVPGQPIYRGPIRPGRHCSYAPAPGVGGGKRRARAVFASKQRCIPLPQQLAHLRPATGRCPHV